MFGEKDRGDGWIKQAAAFGGDNVHGLGMGEGCFVGPRRTQRVVDIGQGHDPGAKGDGLSGQTVGVAATVPLFMMVAGDLDAHLDKAIVGIEVVDMGVEMDADMENGMGVKMGAATTTASILDI